MILKEKHIGTVTSNQDPEQRGRIKASCVGIMGDEDQPMPQWIEPINEWGWFVVPDVGEQIDIEIDVSSSDDENHGATSINTPNLYWRGRHWGGSETDAARPIPDDFKTNYGKRRGFATPGGHVLMFDDTNGQKKVSLTWHGKDNEFAYMAFDETGSWVCGNKTGSLIHLNATDRTAALIDEHGNSMSTSADGMKMVDKSGNWIELKDGVIQLCSTGTVNVKCKNVVLDAGKIDLTDGATEPNILGALFMQYFLAHTHPTGVGPSGPPVPSGAESTLLSTKVFGS